MKPVPWYKKIIIEKKKEIIVLQLLCCSLVLLLYYGDSLLVKLLKWHSIEPIDPPSIFVSLFIVL